MALSECKTEKWNSQLEHGQPMEQREACFAHATRVRLAVNHNTSGKCSKRVARASELGSCQSNLCNS